MSRGNKGRIGANGVWPRVPKFDVPTPPAGYPSGDHITLDEDDERILDKVWAEIRSRPARAFDQTLPPASDAAPQAGPPTDGAGRTTRGEIQHDGPRRNGRRRAEPRPAKRPK
jgi:hypothetical protein